MANLRYRQLPILNCPVILSNRRSTTIPLETCPLYFSKWCMVVCVYFTGFIYFAPTFCVRQTWIPLMQKSILRIWPNACKLWNSFTEISSKTRYRKHFAAELKHEEWIRILQRDGLEKLYNWRCCWFAYNLLYITKVILFLAEMRRNFFKRDYFWV